MIDLKCKKKEMIAQKIDDELFKRRDSRKQMALEEENLFAPEIMVVLLPKGFK